MPESYEPHLSLEAVAFVIGLPKKRQKLVLDLADQIARQPFEIGTIRPQMPRVVPSKIFVSKVTSFPSGWIMRAAKFESARLSTSEKKPNQSSVTLAKETHEKNTASDLLRTHPSLRVRR